MSNNNTEWRTLEVPSYCIEEYSEKCYLLHMPVGYSNSNCRSFIYISKKLVRFVDKDTYRVSYLPHMTWLAKGCISREMTADRLEEIFAEYRERKAAWDAEKEEENEEEEAPAQVAAPAPNEWGKVAINAQNVERTTDKAALINMPHSSAYDGFSVWVSLKLLRSGRHSYEYMLSVKGDMEFTLKKYGKGRYNKSEVIEEKTVNAEELAAAFGGWVEDAPRNTRPAVDPDRVEITRHEPAPLAPVEIEADAELTR